MSNTRPFENNDACKDAGCWPFRRRSRRANAFVTVASGDASGSAGSAFPSRGGGSPPRLIDIRRESSPLLTACWQQDWSAVPLYLKTQQVYHRSAHTGRTALHLATMPGARAPPDVLDALLMANPHAVVTEDYHQYGGTPLNFCCGSKLRLQPAVVKKMVEAAAAVSEEFPEHCFVKLSYVSPFYQAAKWAPPPATLWVLIQAARHQSQRQQSAAPLTWIAPWTGAESWMQDPSLQNRDSPLGTLGPARDSPLRALWRRQTPRRFALLDHDHEDGDDNMPALEEMRQLTQQFYAAVEENRAWKFLTTTPTLLAADNHDHAHDSVYHRHNYHQDNEETVEVARWCKVLVLLQSQAPKLHHLMDTAVSLQAPIPALVRLLTLLWPERLLISSRPNHDDGDHPKSENSRLPLHWAMTRYVATESPPSLRAEAGQVLKILAQAQPSTLTVPDPCTNLAPALQAAASDAPVDLIYTLLRPVPTVLPTS